MLFYVFILISSGQANNNYGLTQQLKIDSLKKKSAIAVDSVRSLCLIDLANEYRIIGDLNLAKTYADSALFIANKIGWLYGKSLSYQNLAYINLYESDFEAAMKNAVSALQIAEKNNDKENQGFAFLYIGYINQSLGENKEVLYYFRKSLELRKELGDNYNLGYSYTYIGNYYSQFNNYDSSLYYHTQALNVRLKTSDTRSIADSYLLIGSTLFQQKKYNAAIKNYDFAIEKYHLLNDKKRLAELYRNYAEIYIYKNELELAEKHLFQALKLAQEIGAIENLIPIYNELANLQEQKGDFKKAYAFVRKHINFKDSISSNNIYREITKQISKYKIEKEKAIQEKNKAVLLAKNKTQQYILIGAFLLIILLTGIAILIARTLKLTKSQKEVIEDQNREIVDSITYAKRIQEAILPTAQLIKKCLPESFIYYKPKDIVAGDFYWIEQQGDNIFFAAADCTGHGVPGAMVSVVCHNAMNSAIKELNIIEPGKILDKTREIVVAQFNKSENSEIASMSIRDGMDIALCVLNSATNELKYAGAFSPLWILRSKANQIEEIKANRQPVGKVDNPESFKTHAVNLEKGDSVYVFSDGYADQFGGVKGKKLMYKPFKKLLVSIKNESMEDKLKLLNSYFENWKGELEQVDDVCIIGVKI
ncbi:MAG: hypothetical protein COA97_04130 [Flavobacteriales bacterium]|nr:MAG: hypothetical protein COA97_04130 [Flavobacteriales bacterium]